MDWVGLGAARLCVGAGLLVASGYTWNGGSVRWCPCVYILLKCCLANTKVVIKGCYLHNSFDKTAPSVAANLLEFTHVQTVIGLVTLTPRIALGSRNTCSSSGTERVRKQTPKNAPLLSRTSYKALVPSRVVATSGSSRANPADNTSRSGRLGAPATGAERVLICDSRCSLLLLTLRVGDIKTHHR